MELHDLKVGGDIYTYFCQIELKLSKLNRFLMCLGFLNHFPSVSVIALPRELFNHCPILLQITVIDFEKPPYRFFNSWMWHDGFKQIMFSSWENYTGYGTADRYLAAKLKFLKNERNGVPSTFQRRRRSCKGLNRD